LRAHGIDASAAERASGAIALDAAVGELVSVMAAVPHATTGATSIRRAASARDHHAAGHGPIRGRAAWTACDWLLQATRIAVARTAA